MNSLKTVKILLSPLRLHSASSIQIPQSTNRYNSMLPPVYVSPIKLHSATKINLHGVSDSAIFKNHLKVRLSPLKSPVLVSHLFSHLYSGTLGVSIEEVQCIPLFLSAMPRGVAVANIYVVNQLLNLTLMEDNFL